MERQEKTQAERHTTLPERYSVISLCEENVSEKNLERSAKAEEGPQIPDLEHSHGFPETFRVGKTRSRRLEHKV